MQSRLSGKVAVITGAGGGLGREISLEFAREGAKVVITDIRKKELQDTVEIINQEIPNAAEGIIMDVSDPSSISDTARLVEEKYAQVDILINNAAKLRYNHIFDFSLEDWDRMIDINLRGYFLTIQSFAQIMARTNRGKIVNVSSVAATSGVPGGGAYSASKGGINAMTRVIANDLSKYNINVNAIAPGPIEGEFLNANSDEEGQEARINKTLFKRLGTYRDIAKPIVFLASADADWITGTVLTVDGGYTV